MGQSDTLCMGTERARRPNIVGLKVGTLARRFHEAVTRGGKTLEGLIGRGVAVFVGMYQKCKPSVALTDFRRRRLLAFKPQHLKVVLAARRRGVRSTGRHGQSLFM